MSKGEISEVREWTMGVEEEGWSIKMEEDLGPLWTTGPSRWRRIAAGTVAPRDHLCISSRLDRHQGPCALCTTCRTPLLSNMLLLNLSIFSSHLTIAKSCIHLVLGLIVCDQINATGLSIKSFAQAALKHSVVLIKETRTTSWLTIKKMNNFDFNEIDFVKHKTHVNTFLILPLGNLSKTF